MVRGQAIRGWSLGVFLGVLVRPRWFRLGGGLLLPLPGAGHGSSIASGRCPPPPVGLVQVVGLPAGITRFFAKPEVVVVGTP